MKKHRIIKALSTLAIALMLLSLVALPICADTTNSPQIQINPDFDANATLKLVVNLIVATMALIGAIFGGWKLVMGQINDDPKERNGGILTLVLCLVAGTIVLVVFNTAFLQS